MNTIRCLRLLPLLLLFAWVARAAQPPGVLQHQGFIQSAGLPFNGTGSFKFALVDGAGTTTYWSNDGTSVDGQAPTAAVSVPVSQGRYAVALGDTSLANMTAAIPASVFADQSDVRLRVWFDDGTNGWQELAPDPRILSVGYALSAAQAQGVVDGAISTTMLANGAVGAGQLAPEIGVWERSGLSIAYGQSEGTLFLHPFFQPFNGTSLLGSLRAENGNGPQLRLEGPAGGFVDIGQNSAGSFVVENAGDTAMLTVAQSGDVSVLGGVSAAQFAGDGAGLSGLWKLGGNAGTTAGTHFLGTTDNQALELKVNGVRALRLEYPTVGTAPNVIGGSANNAVHAGTDGAAIGGGRLNTIQTGAYQSTIGGGGGNTIKQIAEYSTIGGGSENTIELNALRATIPGGSQNRVGVSASYAFAAGRRANANHPGTFVWADSQNADFASTGNNQFLIRASGGVGIGTNELAGAALRVAGSVVAESFMGAGIALMLGTSDEQPLELKVNGQRALRLEYPTVGTLPNVIGGSMDNSIEAGIQAAVIGGGAQNTIQTGATNATIGGGLHNTIHAHRSSIGGGEDNTIQANAGSSIIAGGSLNTIEQASYRSTIGGGYLNTIQGFAQRSTIGGGETNTIGTGATDATIGGGRENRILENAVAALIGGGRSNHIGARAEDATIAGGGSHTISDDSNSATIGGGWNNTIGTESDWATIAGGGFHTIENQAFWAAIGGGGFHTISSASDFVTIGGGAANRVGSNAQRSTISGGDLNEVAGGAAWASVGGGLKNRILDNAAYSVISGGASNTVASGAYQSTVGGGYWNTIQANATSSTVGGGYGNTIQTNVGFSTIGGGYQNTIQTFVGSSTIGGGFLNTIQTNASVSTVGGGYRNTIQANALYSTIPGGSWNSIGTDAWYAFAAGRRAQANHPGAFVWADSQDADFASTATNELSARALGGVRFTSGGAGGNQTVAWTPGSGSWSFTSDRSTKEALQQVDSRDVLEKVASLSISEWNYRGYRQRHIGPMAQDFHERFPLNDDATQLNAVDLHGVALAAIQGLNQKLEQENAALRSTVESLAARLAALEARLETATSSPEHGTHAP